MLMNFKYLQIKSFWSRRQYILHARAALPTPTPDLFLFSFVFTLESELIDTNVLEPFIRALTSFGALEALVE